MDPLGTRWRVPRKTNDRAWRELAQEVRRREARKTENQFTEGHVLGQQSEYRAEYRLRRVKR